VTISNGIKALLRFGFFIIAACTVLDCVLFVALGYRYAKTVLFPVDPAKLETPSTYINFDLLYRNGTKTSSQFAPIRALPRALAHVSSKEPDRVYPQWPMSFLAPYGSVPQNDRRLLVDPEVNYPSTPSGFAPGPPCCKTANSELDLDVRSVPRVGLRDGELQPRATNS